MKKPGETHIETYVRFPEELSVNDIEWIEKWIKSDESVRLLAMWFKSFYKLTEESLEDVTTIKKRPAAISLKPLKPIETRGRRRFVLAAQTTAANNRKIDTLKTFISEEDHTLIRILNNREKERTSIHIVSDLLQKDDVVIMEIPDENVHLVIQEEGRLELPAENEIGDQVKSWESCILMFPVCRANVSREDSVSDGYIPVRTESGLKSLEISQQQDRVILDLSGLEPGEKSRTHYMVIKSGSKATLWPAKNGSVTVPADQFKNRKSQLYFYQ